MGDGLNQPDPEPAGITPVNQIGHGLGGFAHRHRQDPGGHRVQGPGVTNLGGARRPADTADDGAGTQSLGLVDDDPAVDRLAAPFTCQRFCSRPRPLEQALSPRTGRPSAR